MAELNQEQRDLLVRYHFKVLNQEQVAEAEKLIRDSEEAVTALSNMDKWAKGEEVYDDAEAELNELKKYWPSVSKLIRSGFSDA